MKIGNLHHLNRRHWLYVCLVMYFSVLRCMKLKLGRVVGDRCLRVIVNFLR